MNENLNQEVNITEQQNQNIENQVVEQNIEQKVEQKPQKKRKKKLLLLLVLLLLTAVMLVSSTYAWFTSNRTVTVADINVNVAAAGGIQISVDASAWKSVVTNDDLEDAHLTYAAATNQLPNTLRPVSSALDTIVTGGYLSMWLGTVSAIEDPSDVNNGEYILSTEDISTVGDNSVTPAVTNQGENGNFVMFDVFIRLDGSANNEPQKLYLTNGSNVVVTSGSSDLGTQNSARVAFLKEGSTTVSSGSNETILANARALNGATVNDIILWEPNYDTHTSTGLSNAYTYYNTTNQGSQYTPAQSGTKVTYYGVKGSILETDKVLLKKANSTDTTGNKFASVTSDIATAANWNTGSTYEELLTLTPNTITKLRIYFWVEGQDVDCENNASGGEITLKLQFSLNDAPAATTSPTPTPTP